MAINLDALLLFTLESQVGAERVFLFGAFEALDGEVRAIISSVASGIPPELIPAGLTLEIVSPLGMPGVVLTELSVTGSITKSTGGESFDLAVQGQAVFPNLPQLKLDAAVVLEDGAGRLAQVTLTSQPPFTLTQVLTGLIGGGAGWAQAVTDQFAFVSGELYYLAAPAGSPSTYTYSYTPPGGIQTIYSPGFHAVGNFTIFAKYAFSVRMGVGAAIDAVIFNLPSDYAPASTDLTVITTAPAEIDLWLVVLTAPMLEIARLQTGTILRVRSTLTILNTALPISLAADYDTASNGFSGQVEAKVAGYDLTLQMLWSEQAGFQIVGLDGLGTNPFALMQQFEDILNQVRSGGCAQIVADWLDGAASSTLKPSLSSGITRDDNGDMTVPFALIYDLRFDDHSIYTITIPLTAHVTPPTSLDSLPGALWDTLTASAADIATAVLGDQGAYEALAIEVGKRVGASAFARFICRALQEALEDLAKAIAEEATALATDTIAAVAELAGALVAVALIGVKVVLSLFEAIWDEVKSWFSGSDDSKKKEAEDKINAVWDQVKTTVADVDASIAQAKSMMTISALNVTATGAAADMTVISTASWAGGHMPVVDSGGSLALDLAYLTGAPGDQTGLILLSQSLTASDATVSLADLQSRLPPDAAAFGYAMNARVAPVLTGIVFMSPDTAKRIDDAVGNLNSLGNDTASGFAQYLSDRRAEYVTYNTKGIQGAYAYANTDVPVAMTVGRSRIGLSTRPMAHVGT